MRNRLLLAAAVIAAVASASPSANAQIGPNQMPGYATSVFEPSQRGSDWFANESNDYRGAFRLSLGVVGDYSYRSVIGAYNPDATVATSIVRNQVFLHAGGALVFADRFRLGLSVPIQAFADGHEGVVGPDGLQYRPPLHEQSVGDIRATLDVNLLGTYGDPFTMAIGASVWFPVGQRESFDGDDVTRFEPHINLAGDIIDSKWAWSARAGYELRPLRENYLFTRTGSQLTFGGALGLRFADHAVLIGPEIYGATTVTNDDAFSQKDSPIEGMMGFHFKVLHDFRINAGVGTHLVNAYGAAPIRTTLGFEWFPDVEKPDRDKDGIPDDQDACPDQAGPPNADPKLNGCPPPPPDRDGDGIIDSLDACPDTKGIATNDPKTNGCPDRDGDGVIDPVDACPDVPGVATDDPKTNGCPADRDGDGIYDKDDACPDVKGIHTDDPKTNGCPDTDRDKDGILNDDDACPDEAGPKSSDPKTNGCPRVFIKNAQIQILEQPKFDFNKADIKPESDSLLTEVAKVMTDHPEIKKVRVEGHTDNKGADAYNQRLSEQRAASVVKWLTSHGVAEDRLVSKGLGASKPLVANDTDAIGRAAAGRRTIAMP